MNLGMYVGDQQRPGLKSQLEVNIPEGKRFLSQVTTNGLTLNPPKEKLHIFHVLLFLLPGGD